MKAALLQSRLLILALACLLPVGCSSSDSATVTPTLTPTATTPISGTVNAGPVDGCKLTVLDANGNMVAGPVTSSQGGFTVNVPDSQLGNNLVFQCSGGTFIDEATGSTTNAGTLSAQLDFNTLAAGIAVNLSPGSTMIRELVATGLDKSAAEAAFAAAFGYTPNPSVTPSMDGSGSDEENLAGLRAGAFSWMTRDVGLQPDEQFALLDALVEDLTADGTLDGVGSVGMTLPGDIINRFSACLIEQGNAMGLAADKFGTLPFAMVAETASYRIEYQPGMMGAMQGKTVFKLMITDVNTGAPVTGATPELTATMTMASKTHGTPVDGVIESGNGLYEVTMYYLMASTMNGMSAGYWSIDVTLNSETATFYPDVSMAMGDTSKATLKDANDMMADGSVRPYFIFKDSLSGVTDSHNLSLFIATRESMMSHPPLAVGLVLQDELAANWSVDTVMVEVSTDNGTSWTTMTDNNTGHWSVTGLTGLTQSQSATVLVRLTVNGVVKTTNGLVDGDLASFTFTPK